MGHRARTMLLTVVILAGVGLLPGPTASSGPGAGDGQAQAPADAPRTYCNPLPIPDYPVGRLVRDAANGAKTDDSHLWLLDHIEQYRELADITALWHDGKWYLYPSVDMAWVSADMGATWEHHPLNVRDLGYAPTIVEHRGRFLLMASASSVYAADSPLGPFKELGPIKLPASLPEQTDPMLFSDDGHLYYYWGCTPSRGIYAVELDANDPTRVIGQPREVIPFRPDLFPWERVGEHNQNPNVGWIEGSWMIKRNGTYILTFSAAGTENGTYAVGAYTGRSPLGPFTPQARNPVLRSPSGLITGTSHGSIVAGPEGRLWAFYTLRAAVVHGFERRIGMDRVEVDDHGEIFVGQASSTPQWLPGKAPAGSSSSDTGWLPLNVGVQTLASTSALNSPGRLAVDDELRTWWQPAEGDARPTLTSRLLSAATVHAVRIAWRDIGLDTTRGVKPGPFKYRVEAETSPNTWTTLIDRSASNDDLLVDYRECRPTVATRVRLVVTGWPKGITPGVAEFTAFGETVKARR